MFQWLRNLFAEPDIEESVNGQELEIIDAAKEEYEKIFTEFKHCSATLESSTKRKKRKAEDAVRKTKSFKSPVEDEPADEVEPEKEATP